MSRRNVKQEQQKLPTFRAGLPEANPLEVKRSEDREGKILTLKPNALGYYEIPLHILKEARIILPRGFETLGVNLCYVYPPTGMPEVGLTKERPTLMPTDDLEKLFQVRGILAGTEKLADRQAEKAEIDQMIYNVGHTMASINVGSNLKPETMRLYSLVDNLLSSSEAITTNRSTNVRNTEMRTFLNGQVQKLAEVLTAQIADVLDSTRNKTDLRDRLIAAGTCNYLWNKMVNNRINLSVDSPLELVLFPMKTDSGMALTTNELRSAVVRNAFQAYLANSGPIVRLVNTPNFNGTIGCINPIGDEKEILRVERFPWRIIPSIPRAEAILSRRITHQAPDGHNHLMQKINEFYLDLYLGICPLGMEVVNFWSQTIEQALDPQSAIPLNQQASTLITANPASNTYNKARGDQTRDLLTHFGVVNLAIRDMIADAADIVYEAAIPIVATHLLDHLDDPQTNVVTAWISARPQLIDLVGKTKKGRKNFIFYLSKEAKELLNEIEDDEDHPLHNSYRLLKSFLGSFQDERYQSIAVRMFASYEESDE